mmetsp:Transcript_35222/g.109683  ORF Transcript_35222/g.109683 Transcript_35222/m.109683 type:complete len:320 (-) Transcript_35222:210-1169(-)
MIACKRDRAHRGGPLHSYEVLPSPSSDNSLMSSGFEKRSSNSFEDTGRPAPSSSAGAADPISAFPTATVAVPPAGPGAGVGAAAARPAGWRGALGGVGATEAHVGRRTVRCEDHASRGPEPVARRRVAEEGAPLLDHGVGLDRRRLRVPLPFRRRPLPDVAHHVVEAKGVLRAEGGHWRCAPVAILGSVPGAVVLLYKNRRLVTVAVKVVDAAILLQPRVQLALPDVHAVSVAALACEHAVAPGKPPLLPAPKRQTPTPPRSASGRRAGTTCRRPRRRPRTPASRGGPRCRGSRCLGRSGVSNRRPRRATTRAPRPPAA